MINLVYGKCLWKSSSNIAFFTQPWPKLESSIEVKNVRTYYFYFEVLLTDT